MSNPGVDVSVGAGVVVDVVVLVVVDVLGGVVAGGVAVGVAVVVVGCSAVFSMTTTNVEKLCVRIAYVLLPRYVLSTRSHVPPSA
jgi:hypothetical protein